MSKKRSFNKAQEEYIKKFAKTLSDKLEMVPRDEWGAYAPPHLLQAWRSKKYVVQVYNAPGGVFRLSINRVNRHKGNWADKITWDELQSIKSQVGFGDWFAVEVYPKDKDVVNVANMRHLWVLPFPLSFAWTQDGGE